MRITFAILLGMIFTNASYADENFSSPAFAVNLSATQRELPNAGAGVGIRWQRYGFLLTAGALETNRQPKDAKNSNDNAALRRGARIYRVADELSTSGFYVVQDIEFGTYKYRDFVADAENGKQRSTPYFSVSLSLMSSSNKTFGDTKIRTGSVGFGVGFELRSKDEKEVYMGTTPLRSMNIYPELRFSI